MMKPAACFRTLAAALLFAVPGDLRAQQSKPSSFFDRYCVGCHNDRLKTAGLSLMQADAAKPGAQPELWEKVLGKLRAGVMPPPGALQPSEADRQAALSWLETSLDAASIARPNPGRTE